MTAEVIQFPKDKIVRFDASLGNVVAEKIIEGDIEKLKVFRHLLIREYMSEMVPMLFNALQVAGFEVSNIKHNKHAALIAEAIRAFMEAQKNIHHPFHQFAEIMFDYDESGKYLVLKSQIEIVEGDKNAPSNVGDSGQSVQDEDPQGTP